MTILNASDCRLIQNLSKIVSQDGGVLSFNVNLSLETNYWILNGWSAVRRESAVSIKRLNFAFGKEIALPVMKKRRKTEPYAYFKTIKKSKVIFAKSPKIKKRLLRLKLIKTLFAE